VSIVSNVCEIIQLAPLEKRRRRRRHPNPNWSGRPVVAPVSAGASPSVISLLAGRAPTGSPM